MIDWLVEYAWSISESLLANFSLLLRWGLYGFVNYLFHCDRLLLGGGL